MALTLDQEIEEGEVSRDASDVVTPLVPDSEKELEDFVAKQALSSDDRYRILEARDKILRLRNPKVKVRVEFAVRLKGSCPDMCPEKERYMREVQRRLASYECMPGGDRDYSVNHETAIKEYSRSSADQEEPLPHDLRPVSTLHLTFNYLLHHIINRCENESENLKDWYCFVWDRTRGIRKDMTQQQLCDLESVALMEKCTRFHIYCSSRLCEMDRHAFDPKLNDENLMKCLQSLEHMYTDLNLKGVECPNEPEFRAYELLMNLNEGDILWEIQQRPARILEAPEVKMALKIQMAVFSRNFVSFFRLVEQVPYLTACIIHRYFFQIRTSAIRSLVKAHTTPKNTGVPMSMATAKRFLGFDEISHHKFIYFCELHGILCDEENETILLNKRDLNYPEAPIINREYHLIDAKLKVSVSEAINGAPLVLFPNYVPYSSFDENGYLKVQVLAELMMAKKPVIPKPLFTPITTSTSSLPQPQQGLTLSTRSRTETKSPTPMTASSVVVAPSIVRIRPHTQPVAQQSRSDITDKTKGGAGRLFLSSISSIFGGGGAGGKRQPATGSRLPAVPKKSIKDRLAPAPSNGNKSSEGESKISAGIFGSASNFNEAETAGTTRERRAPSPFDMFAPQTSKLSSTAQSISVPSESKRSSTFPVSNVFGIKKDPDALDAKVSAFSSAPSSKTSPGGFSFRLPTLGVKPEPTEAQPAFGIKQEPSDSSATSGFQFGIPKGESSKSADANLFSSSQFKPIPGSIFGQSGAQGFGQSTGAVGIGSIFSPPQFGAQSNIGTKTEDTRFEKQKVAEELTRQTETKIINEVVVQEVHQLSKESLKAAIIEKEAQIQREKQQALQKIISNDILKKIEKQVVEQLVGEASKREIERFELYQKLTIEVGSGLFYDVVKELATQIAHDAHEQATKESEQRAASARVILKRLKLRSWLQKWRTQAVELKKEREARIEKQLQNLENFPPVVSFQLSPATILGTWFGFRSPMVKTRRISFEPSPMEFIERSVKLKKSFAQKLDDLAPRVLDYLTADLTSMLEREEIIRGSALNSEFLPPVVFNIVLWSDFGPSDRLANWLWTSLSQDCMYLRENILAHSFRLRYGHYAITFEKSSGPSPGILQAFSSETFAVIVFCRTEQYNFEMILSSLLQPTTLLVFNSSKMSEAQIRRSVKRSETELLHDLCVVNTEETMIVDDVPAIVSGFQWLSISLPRGLPLNPVISFPPLNHAISTLFETYLQYSMKRVTCASMLFQQHNNLVVNLNKIVSPPTTVSALSDFVGYATWNWAEKCDIQLPRPTLEFPDKLQDILWIEPPEELLYHFHESLAMTEAKYRELIRDYARNLYIPDTPSIVFTAGIEEVLAAPWKGLHNVPWKKLLLTCQRYKVACIEALIPTAFDPICVDLTELKNAGALHEDTYCPDCNALVNRKRSLADDQRALQSCPPAKTPRHTQTSANSLLQEINDFMRQVKEEKSLLESTPEICLSAASEVS